MSSRSEIDESLIAGALALVATSGSAELSVRSLASAGGRSTMCVYSHFGGRGGLLTAAYARAAEGLLQAMDAAVSDATAADAAGRAREAYLAWAGQDLRRYRLLFASELEPLDIDPAVRGRLVDDVAERLGGRDRWAAAHGEVSLDLVTIG
ncbi:TetR/AcrR family transcriptional regulator [Georgenia sp. Z1344]|uniref:TetR/AcrR family transcriptional regulator n=1 Tax=Georgenia sp. Z1344 TaxID=3416706 RepID=UPI003CFA4E60